MDKQTRERIKEDFKVLDLFSIRIAYFKDVGFEDEMKALYGAVNDLWECYDMKYELIVNECLGEEKDYMNRLKKMWMGEPIE